MTTIKFRPLTMAASMLALAGSAGIANAQAAAAPRPAAAAAPAAAAPLPTGPVIPGVCVFSNEAAIASSAVGKYVGTRLQQLETQANAEVTGEKTSIETEGKALEGQRATITTDAYQQRALTLQQRVQALQRKAEVRSRELEATQQKAVGRVATEINPLLRQVYASRNCGLLLDRNAVFGANPSMDITADVVKLLDGKITTFAFDRERLDQQAAAAGAAARPAAPARTQ